MPFSTSEVLAHAQFAEFDAADLAFRVGETAALLNARCSDRVDADTVVRLHERVEGWRMGLQLALVDLEKEADAVQALRLSGIGFLGAGVIMREEGNVRAINTAATLWGSAAVGAAAGADLILEATLGCVFVLAANTLLRPIVNAINRKPLDVTSAEVTNTVYVIADRTQRKAVLARLEEELYRCHYPTRDLEVHAFGEDEVEIEATLAATSVDGGELDALVQRLVALPTVRQAFWSPSTSE